MNDDPQDSTERPAAAKRRPRRGRVLGLLGSAGLAAAGLAIVATTVSSAPSLPDLISEQTGPGRTHVYRDGRLLMRFDGFVSNAASAPAELEIWANNPNGQGVMTQVQQRVSGVAVPTGRSPVVRFEEADGHRHYHLKNAAEYTLWTADRSRQVALAQKTEAGFCLEDSLYNGGSGPAEYSANANDFCLQVDPGQTWRPGPLVMGVSPGYRDLYDAGLSYQWVDISNTPPGNYQLASRTDPTDAIAESNEGNNGYAFRAAVVPGFLPRQLSVGRVDPGQTANVALASDEFISECYDDSPSPSDTPYCNPGSVRYRIASLPTRGVIRQNGAALGVGSVLTSGAITYTANGGQRGGDQFTYEAFDISRPDFPVQKPQAAVAIQVGAPIVTVAISGAQASITAGVSMQLSAVLTNSTRGVNWSASAGSITPGGLFTAPKTAGTVTIRATSAEDPSASAAVSVKVTPAKVQAPAPTARDPFPRLTAGRNLLSPLKVKRIATRSYVAKVVAGRKGGQLRVTVTNGRKVIKTKLVALKARKGFIYRVTLTRGVPLAKVRITARFTPKGSRTTIVRRAGIARL